MVSTIAAPAVTFVVTAVLTYLLTALRTQKSKFSARDKADKYLLKDRITQACLHYIERGAVHPYELESLLGMSGVYFELGGNSYVHSLIDKVKKLPIKE